MTTSPLAHASPTARARGLLLLSLLLLAPSLACAQERDTAPPEPVNANETVRGR